MSCIVSIEGLVKFAPNVGVIVEREAIEADPGHLHALIRRAYSHMDDQLLLDACCGACGPLADVGEIDYREYLKHLGRNLPDD